MRVVSLEEAQSKKEVLIGELINAGRSRSGISTGGNADFKVIFKDAYVHGKKECGEICISVSIELNSKINKDDLKNAMLKWSSACYHAFFSYGYGISTDFVSLSKVINTTHGFIFENIAEEISKFIFAANDFIDMLVFERVISEEQAASMRLPPEPE